MRTWIVLFLFTCVHLAHAQMSQEPSATIATDKSSPSFVYVQLQQHTADELQQALLRAEQSVNDPQSGVQAPVLVVINGAELASFERKNYRDQKALVDLAARLAAFELIEIRVCQKTLEERLLQAKELPSFLVPVANGDAYITEKRRQGYVSL